MSNIPEGISLFHSGVPRWCPTGPRAGRPCSQSHGQPVVRAGVEPPATGTADSVASATPTPQEVPVAGPVHGGGSHCRHRSPGSKGRWAGPTPHSAHATLFQAFDPSPLGRTPRVLPGWAMQGPSIPGGNGHGSGSQAHWVGALVMSGRVAQGPPPVFSPLVTTSLECRINSLLPQPSEACHQ